MSSQLTMTQEKQKIIDAGRRKELKKAAKKAATGANNTAVKEKTNGADKRREQDTADLRQMLAEASSLEDAREIYEKLGKDLIPEEKFEELSKRFKTEPNIESAQESNSRVTPQKKPEEASATSEEELAISPETIALRNAVNNEIGLMEQWLGLYDKLAASKKVAEEIELAILDNETLADDESLREIYKARNKKNVVAKYRGEVEAKIQRLQEIYSSTYPYSELERAVTDQVLSPTDVERISAEQRQELAQQGIIEPTETEEGTAPVEIKTPSEAKKEEPTSDNKTSDLYEAMEQSRQESAKEKTHEIAERRKRKAAFSPDDEEFKARAKTRRRARMEREGASEEEIEAFEMTEAEFEPTPEMLAISEEIKSVEKIAEDALRQVQALDNLDETTIVELGKLNFTFRHLESLRVALKRAEVIAKKEFEERKEAAQKLLGRAPEQADPQHFLHIKGNLRTVNFRTLLRAALKNLITAEKERPKSKKKRAKISQPAPERRVNQFVDELQAAYAEGSLTKDGFMEELDAAFAEGNLGKEECMALRNVLNP